MATKETDQRWPVPIHVRVGRETAEQIRELAVQRDMSVGTLARQALTQYLRETDKR